MRCYFAEAEGFEPPVPFSTTVFKTAAIDHSATPPEYVKKTLFFLREELPMEQDQVDGAYRDAAVREIKHRLEEDVAAYQRHP